MPLRLLPNVEALVVAWLRASTEIGDLVADRVGTELYAGAGAALQVILVDGEERVPRHLDAVRIQVDAWGGSKLDAFTLAGTARAVLLEAPASTHSLGVVNDVRTLVRPRWLPDDSVTPPRPRYSADYELVIHPV